MSWAKVPFLDFLKKAIENIISLTATATGSTTLSNGQGATFVITTTTTSGNRSMVIHDWTLYVGSVADANKLPNGSGVDMTKWIVTPFVNDWGDTDNKNTVAKIYVQNVSAGANQSVLLRVQARLIQNSTTLGGTA